MAEQKQQQAFRIKNAPIECPCGECCEYCSLEGDDKICTWEPVNWDPIGFKNSGESAPCWYWEDYFQDARFVTPLKASILDKSGQKIGELSGWWLNPYMIFDDEQGSFSVLDAKSALLERAHHLIITQKPLFCRTSYSGAIPFITRLSLLDEFRSPDLELKILKAFLDNNGVIIYSLGYTELDDNEFFEYQDDVWQSYWEEKLRKLGWLRNECLWYAFDHEQQLYVPDPILFDEE